MKLPKEYISDLLVRMTHHSSAIENNTISLDETVSILLHDTIPNKLSVREFYEVENHKYAVEYLLQQMEQNEPLSLSTVHNTHAYL